MILAICTIFADKCSLLFLASRKGLRKRGDIVIKKLLITVAVLASVLFLIFEELRANPQNCESSLQRFIQSSQKPKKLITNGSIQDNLAIVPVESIPTKKIIGSDSLETYQLHWKGFVDEKNTSHAVSFAFVPEAEHLYIEPYIRLDFISPPQPHQLTISLPINHEGQWQDLNLFQQVFEYISTKAVKGEQFIFEIKGIGLNGQLAEALNTEIETWRLSSSISVSHSERPALISMTPEAKVEFLKQMNRSEVGTLLTNTFMNTKLGAILNASLPTDALVDLQIWMRNLRPEESLEFVADDYLVRFMVIVTY